MIETEVSPVMTVPECARLLSLSRGSAYIAIREGSIPSIRIGRRILVPRARLMAMLQGTEQATVKA